MAGPRPPGGHGGLLYGRRPVVELLRAGRRPAAVLIAHGLRPSAVVGEIRRLAADAGVPVRRVDRAELDRVTAGGNHQGVAAETPRYRYASVDDVVGASDAAVLFLDGVTDPHNLGSLLRSAEGAGFGGVVVPAHRAAGVTAAVRRVSAGAAEIVPVARVANLGAAVERARGAGLWIVGLDADAAADIYGAGLSRPLGLVLGSEDRGISKGVRARCDEIVRIPGRGRLSSLNVAIAGAIAMYELVRRDADGGGRSDRL